MSSDAALYARLVAMPKDAAPPPPPEEDLRLLAARLASGARDMLDVLQEAAGLMAGLRQGRRDVTERLAATIARAETAAEVQASRVRNLLRYLS